MFEQGKKVCKATPVEYITITCNPEVLPVRKSTAYSWGNFFHQKWLETKQGQREDIIADFNLYNLSSVKPNRAKYPKLRLPRLVFTDKWKLPET